MINELNWGVVSATLLLLALGAYYWGFEKTKMTSKELALIATLAALAALGRVPFAAIPNVQPTTFMVLVAGFVYGPRAGFMVGSLAAFSSNFFLGQGPWTPWQMLAWGLIGASAGLLGKWKPDLGISGLAVFSFIWGYLFGWIMNLSYWLVFVYPLNLQSFLTAYAASFYFDSLHAAGNLAFTMIMGPMAVQVLVKFRERLSFTYQEN